MKPGVTPASQKPRKKRWMKIPCHVVQAGAQRNTRPQQTMTNAHAWKMIVSKEKTVYSPIVGTRLTLRGLSF